MNTDMKKPWVETRAKSKAISIETSTHCGKILAALLKRPMSNIELMQELNIAHPPAAVRDLHQGGVRIDSMEHPHPSKLGKKINRYYLIEEK